MSLRLPSTDPKRAATDIPGSALWPRNLQPETAYETFQSLIPAARGEIKKTQATLPASSTYELEASKLLTDFETKLGATKDGHESLHQRFKDRKRERLLGMRSGDCEDKCRRLWDGLRAEWADMFSMMGNFEERAHKEGASKVQDVWDGEGEDPPPKYSG